ncbi:Stress-associated endoplasmic reticulum protein 1, partial [Ophiophagus hannah]
MVAKQRIRMANEKHSKNITQRGNVAKTSVGAPSQPCRAALLAPLSRSSRRAEKRPRGEGIGGTVAAGVVYLRGLRFGDLPDYSEYQDGHVKELVFKQDIFSCEL